MTTARMTASPPLHRLVLVAASMVTAPAFAAAVGVAVVDAAGKPLADAVALLEPVARKVAVKPMADTDISQAKRQFQPRVTLVTVGTRIGFPNFDTVRHHVYSFSPIKTFELKLYAGTPSAPIVFDKPGIGVIGCNIHDSMAAWIVVAETPWSGLSNATGHLRIDNVPAGAYRLRLWHPGIAQGSEPAPISVSVDTADVEQTARLAVVPLP